MTTEEAVAARLRAALADKRWRQSDLVRSTGLDKNTVSAIVNAKQRASDATLGAIEDALGLTRGTLAASEPEERPMPVRPSEETYLSAASEAEIMAELTYRIEFLKRSYRDAIHELGIATTGTGVESYGMPGVNGADLLDDLVDELQGRRDSGQQVELGEWAARKAGPGAKLDAGDDEPAD